MRSVFALYRLAPGGDRTWVLHATCTAGPLPPVPLGSDRQEYMCSVFCGYILLGPSGAILRPQDAAACLPVPGAMLRTNTSAYATLPPVVCERSLPGSNPLHIVPLEILIQTFPSRHYHPTCIASRLPHPSVPALIAWNSRHFMELSI